MKKFLAFILLVVGGIAMAAATYTVDETEQIVITRFGKAVKAVKEPGLHFKIPIIDTAISLEKRVMQWDGDPENMPTLDKKRIYADTFGFWRITDPIKFYTSVRTLQGGQKKLDDLVDPAVRNVVTRHNLIEAVRSTDTPLVFSEGNETQGGRQAAISVGRDGMEQEILSEVASCGLDQFGIEVVFVGFKRVNYVGTVREKVYGRMQAERTRIADLLVSEAKEQANIIRGNMQYELEAIAAEQNREVAKTRGQADADAIRIWSEAIATAPEFYSFLRTMQALEDMPEGSKMVLTTDSEFLSPLKGGNGN